MSVLQESVTSEVHEHHVVLLVTDSLSLEALVNLVQSDDDMLWWTEHTLTIDYNDIGLLHNAGAVNRDSSPWNRWQESVALGRMPLCHLVPQGDLTNQERLVHYTDF